MTEIKNKQCPYCGEYIPVETEICEYCGEHLTPAYQSEIEQSQEVSGNNETEVATETKTENETEEQSFVDKYLDEKSPKNYKLIIFIVSAVVIGLIGTLGILYAVHSSIDTSFNVNKSNKAKIPKILKSGKISNAEINKAKDLYKNKELDKAAELFQAEIDKNDNAVANYYMGEIYKDQGFSKIAIGYYKKANNNKKDFFEPNKRLAEVYSNRSEYEEALSYGESALKLKPNDIEMLKIMAGIYESTDNSDKLLATYKKIVKLDPKDSDANHYLGAYYYRQENYKESSVYINNLLKAEYNTNVAYALVNCYFKMEYYTKAIEVLNRIMSEDPYESYRASYLKDGAIYLRDDYNAAHGKNPISTDDLEGKVEDALF